MKFTRNIAVAIATSICVLAVTAARAGTHIWTGGGLDENWGNPANWTGGQPLVGEAAPVILIFTNGPTTTNNMSGLVVDSLQFQGDGAAVHGSGIGSLTIRGNGGTNLWFKGNLNSLEQTLPLSLTGSNYCVVANALHANIYASIGGTGHVTWDGGGIISYLGTTANTCTGTTHTRAVLLRLAKTAGVNAIAGPLVLDQAAGSPAYAVELLAADQILDSVPVTLNPGTGLLAQGFNETLSDLNMNGGNLNLIGGLLTLSGSVDAAGSATIISPVSLGGGTRTINVTGGSLTLVKAVSNGAATAGINKTGAGELLLQGTNTFTGAVTVSVGTLHVVNDSAFGSTAGGVTVQSGATLHLQDVDIGLESLTLNGGNLVTTGTNVWAGPVNVASESSITIQAGEQLTFSGAVGGAGSLSKFSDGVLGFSGAAANTFSGGFATYGGTVSLNKTAVNAIACPLQLGPGNATVRLQQPNQISDSVVVGMFSGCLVDLNNNSDTIGSLAGLGAVNLVTATLTLGGDNTSSTFSGNISGVGFTPIIKTGTGTFTLAGTNNCTGTSQVNVGTLAVTGQLDSHVSIAASAVLTGSGKVGNVIANAGTIRPGNTTGSLNTGSLNLTNGTVTLTFEINDPTPGTGYDQIAATGAVNLSNPSLALSLNTYGALSNQYVLIANDGTDPVKGTFTGLPEGATLTSGLVSFRITYQGGTGNDVALIQTAAPASPGITNITKQFSGAMTITGTGLPSTAYYVDATPSVNPPNWVNLSATLANPSGVITYTDTDAPNHPQRFYRFRMQ